MLLQGGGGTFLAKNMSLRLTVAPQLRNYCVPLLSQSIVTVRIFKCNTKYASIQGQIGTRYIAGTAFFCCAEYFEIFRGLHFPFVSGSGSGWDMELCSGDEPQKVFR